jgi:hypothetical protein
MHYVEPDPGTAPAVRGRSRVTYLAMIAVFDIGGPLAAYYLLRSAGLSPVKALVLSGVLPALGVAVTFARARRLDAIGGLVLVGIAVGTILGLATGSARLVLVENSVPTAVFGLLCVASLWSRRPLIFRFALEFMGAETAKGRDFDGRWQYEGFRHAFRVITAVWGVGYLAEAAARIVIAETVSTGGALFISKALPFAATGVLAAWTWVYGQSARRRGERMGAEMAAHAAAEQAAAAAQASALEGGVA